MWLYKGPSYVRYIRKTLIVYGSVVHKEVPGYIRKTLMGLFPLKVLFCHPVPWILYIQLVFTKASASICTGLTTDFLQVLADHTSEYLSLCIQYSLAMEKGSEIRRKDCFMLQAAPVKISWEPVSRLEHRSYRLDSCSHSKWLSSWLESKLNTCSLR